MATEKRVKGNTCEELVVTYLSNNGHEILRRNYSCPFGEIDIISLSPDGILCVTEVKSLTSRWTLDNIQYQVGKMKQARIRKTLSFFLAQDNSKSFQGIRFDVAAVTDDRISYFNEAF